MFTSVPVLIYIYKTLTGDSLSGVSLEMDRHENEENLIRKAIICTPYIIPLSIE
jgi:hypothetical protein